MRASLMRQDLPDARTVASMKNGEKIRYAGLVICRQRPGTAGGVVFMTLEDETGFVNVVVWESVFQRYAVLAKTVSFLGISGKLQVEDGVVHLVAEELVGTESRAKTGERAQPGFSLRKLAAKSAKVRTRRIEICLRRGSQTAPSWHMLKSTQPLSFRSSPLSLSAADRSAAGCPRRFYVSARR